MGFRFGVPVGVAVRVGVWVGVRVRARARARVRVRFESSGGHEALGDPAELDELPAERALVPGVLEACTPVRGQREGVAFEGHKGGGRRGGVLT